MESETAYWFLSTLAQVTVTLVGFLVVATIFWLRSPMESRRWRFFIALFLACLIFLGLTMSVYATMEIAELPIGVLDQEDVERLDRMAGYSFAYFLVVAIAIGLLVFIGTLEQTMEGKKR